MSTGKTSKVTVADARRSEHKQQPQGLGTFSIFYFVLMFVVALLAVYVHGPCACLVPLDLLGLELQAVVRHVCVL